MKKGNISESPVHILSAFVTIVLDVLWGFPEIIASLTVVGLPAVLLLMVAAGGTNFMAVTLIQHYIDNDDWNKAVVKGLVLGIAAGVPYPVIGSLAGVVLAGWAGIEHILPSNTDMSKTKTVFHTDESDF
jgi:hypothetical protein